MTAQTLTPFAWSFNSRQKDAAAAAGAAATLGADDSTGSWLADLSDTDLAALQLVGDASGSATLGTTQSMCQSKEQVASPQTATSAPVHVDDAPMAAEALAGSRRSMEEVPYPETRLAKRRRTLGLGPSSTSSYSTSTSTSTTPANSSPEPRPSSATATSSPSAAGFTASHIPALPAATPVAVATSSNGRGPCTGSAPATAVFAPAEPQHHLPPPLVVGSPSLSDAAAAAAAAACSPTDADHEQELTPYWRQGWYKERNKEYSRNWRNKKKAEDARVRRELTQLRDLQHLVEATLKAHLHSHAAAPGAPFAYASPGLLRLLGLEGASVMGMPLLELVVEEDRGVLAAALDALAAGTAGGQAVEITYTFRHPRTGARRCLTTVLRESGGRILALTTGR